MGTLKRAVCHRAVGGQIAVETALVILTVVAALVWMFPYVRSAFCDRMKTGADGVSDWVQDQAKH